MLLVLFVVRTLQCCIYLCAFFCFCFFVLIFSRFRVPSMPFSLSSLYTLPRYIICNPQHMANFRSKKHTAQGQLSDFRNCSRFTFVFLFFGLLITRAPLTKSRREFFQARVLLQSNIPFTNRYLKISVASTSYFRIFFLNSIFVVVYIHGTHPARGNHK